MRLVPPARHLLRAKDLADARYFEPLTVDDLARAAGLSRAHFSREFRRTFGETPHGYLLTRRLERAAALLRTTDLPVVEVCLSVGLRSLGSFTTTFTRTFGASPTAYRARFAPAARHALVPTCFLRAYGRPQRRTFREDTGGALPDHAAHTNDDTGGTDDQDRERAAVGPRPGGGARLLHP
jgi:AraC-like DNA-binding protein